MARYDDILNEQLDRIRESAQQRIAIELSTAPYYDKNADFQECLDKFGSAVNVLEALLFGNLQQTKAEYQKRLSAYVAQYRQPPSEGLDFTEIFLKHAFDEYDERLRAVEARAQKVAQGQGE